MCCKIFMASISFKNFRNIYTVNYIEVYSSTINYNLKFFVEFPVTFFMLKIKNSKLNTCMTILVLPEKRE